MFGFIPFNDSKAFKSQISFMLGDYADNTIIGININDRNLIVQTAEQALRHEFNLLGSGIVKSDPIDWQCDNKCGIRWGKEYYLNIGYQKGADIKMPWELSRCQHLLWLGEAYLLTKDEKYAKEVIDEIDWWIEDNPLMYTVNWRCAMDVSFRAVNWLFSLNMIRGYAGYDDAFSSKVSRSLWQHGFFIRNNIEKVIPDSNNHYASDIVGLLYLGALFSHTRNGKQWKRFAIKEFEVETLNQVLESGVHYERTVSYHRLMTELLSYPVYMLKRIGEPVSHDVIDRIKVMYSYISNYTKPSGLAPLIGDNDDGRFLPFLRRDFRVHNYLNEPYSVENTFVSSGISPMFCNPFPETKLYEDANVAIFRGSIEYLYINHGGYSKRPKDTASFIGTHTHNDLLSFELSVGGKDLLVDSGTYLYTSSLAERNSFRATAKHNTVLVDGEEQNYMVDAFALGRNVFIQRLTQIDQRSYSGSYTTVKGKMRHQRRFIVLEGKIIITDILEKDGDGHIAELFLHFAEGICPIVCTNGLVIGDTVQVAFCGTPEKLEVVDDTFSPSFGVLTNNKTAIASFRFNNSITISTTIQYGTE